MTIAAGVNGITTTCGFLALYQKDLAAHCTVPVAASSLLQLPMVERILPGGKRPAILTFSAEIPHPSPPGCSWCRSRDANPRHAP
jgi:hypothetical protein